LFKYFDQLERRGEKRKKYTTIRLEMEEICMDGGKRRSLLDLVFSWSLDDVMNEDLFRQKVVAFFFIIS
jgi:hypothetical protein